MQTVLEGKKEEVEEPATKKVRVVTPEPTPGTYILMCVCERESVSDCLVFQTMRLQWKR